MAFSRKTVIKAIGSDKLNLYHGNGYWYFEYDDVAANKFETTSIYTCRLNDLPLASWVEEGKAFVAKCEGA